MRVRASLRKSEKGLTLIELLVAMTILALGAIAGLTVLVQSKQTITFSRGKTMATNAAQQQMETIFRDLPTDVGDYDGITFPVGDLVRPGGGDPGVITVDTTQIPRVVIINVAWQGQGTVEPGEITLRALRSEAPR